MRGKELTPFGRRVAAVTANVASGSYRLVTLLDREGPAPQPGEFYMLARESGWGGEQGRPWLPRAISWATAAVGGSGVELGFLIDPVGPGTDLLASAVEGEAIQITGPLGQGFTDPGDLAPAAGRTLLVGGGIGIAPLAAFSNRLGGREHPHRVLLGFRDRAHSGDIDQLFPAGAELAFEDGSDGHHGYVTDLLEPELGAGDAVVYACGPPAMLEAIRRLAVGSETPCELALETPMACGFGACYGCAVPKAGGDGYLRLCLEGPVVRADRIATADPQAVAG